MDAAAEVTDPDVDNDEAVTAVAVSGPVDREADETGPAVEKLLAVTAPDVLSDVAVISTAVRLPAAESAPAMTFPASDAEAADSPPLTERPDVPTETDTAVREPAVTAPEVETEADRRSPVTLTVLAAKLPATVVVRDASVPIATESAFGPIRTMPLAEPAPPSMITSPPIEAPSPEVWPMI